MNKIYTEFEKILDESSSYLLVFSDTAISLTWPKKGGAFNKGDLFSFNQNGYVSSFYRAAHRATITGVCGIVVEPASEHDTEVAIKLNRRIVDYICKNKRFFIKYSGYIRAFALNKELRGTV